MSRFRSTKRAKEISRKARHEAKEARKRERRERALSGEAGDDIDWSQAVGFAPPREEAQAEGDEGSGVEGDPAEREVEESLLGEIPREDGREGDPERER